MKVIEYTLKGYEAGTDTTDHLVKWVSAPTEQMADSLINGLFGGYVNKFDVSASIGTKSLGIDFTVSTDNAFRCDIPEVPKNPTLMDELIAEHVCGVAKIQDRREDWYKQRDADVERILAELKELGFNGVPNRIMDAKDITFTVTAFGYSAEAIIRFDYDGDFIRHDVRLLVPNGTTSNSEWVPVPDLPGGLMGALRLVLRTFIKNRYNMRNTGNMEVEANRIIVWNTGNMYSKHGQRIAAKWTGTELQWYDLDRMIYRSCPCSSWMPSEHTFKQRVMAAYDHYLGRSRLDPAVRDELRAAAETCESLKKEH